MQLPTSKVGLTLLTSASIALFVVGSANAYDAFQLENSDETEDALSGGATADESFPSGQLAQVKASFISTEDLPNAHAGKNLSVSGSVRPATAGRDLSLSVVSKGRLNRVDTTKTYSDGKFQLNWVPKAPGKKNLRLHIDGDERSAMSNYSLKVNVFKEANASYYGPGFYGRKTACGQTMTPGSVHVAHKTLPCGTKMKFFFGGKVVDAVVKDRGPFIPGRTFDLSEGLKNRLGFGSTGVVGYMVER